MDSVMDDVNISSIYHATQKRQLPHYQTIKDLKRGNVRDVMDKMRKKLSASRKNDFALKFCIFRMSR